MRTVAQMQAENETPNANYYRRQLVQATTKNAEHEQTIRAQANEIARLRSVNTRLLVIAARLAEIMERPY